MNKQELINYLDTYLDINSIEDDSKNGLQVDNEKTEIKKIGYAVDATNYIFDLGIKEQVDMILVHHGLFRGHEQVVTDIHYKRLKKLLDNDIALYGCHLPLDAHPEVGNNIVLAKKFIEYFNIKNPQIQPINVGYELSFKEPIPYDQLPNFCQNIGIEDRLYMFNKQGNIQSVIICSGGGKSFFDPYIKKNYDLFLTGEENHGMLVKGKEKNIPILLGGHYETEVFGVQALSEHLKQKYNIEIVFLDEKY